MKEQFPVITHRLRFLFELLTASNHYNDDGNNNRIGCDDWRGVTFKNDLIDASM